MFSYYSILKNKFDRAFNKITKEKPFLLDYKEFLAHHYNYLVTSQYISAKYSLTKSESKDYNKMLRRLSQIDNFSDRELLEYISRLNLKIIFAMLSLIHNEDDLNFLWKEYFDIKRENISLKSGYINQLDEKKEFINAIVKTKNDLIKSNSKVSQNKVAEKLKIPPSSFRDKLKKHKIEFKRLG